MKKVFIMVPFSKEVPAGKGEIFCITKVGTPCVGYINVNEDGTFDCAGHESTFFDVAFWLKAVEVPENTTEKHLECATELKEAVEFCESVIRNGGAYDLSEKMALGKASEVINKIESL